MGIIYTTLNGVCAKMGRTNRKEKVVERVCRYLTKIVGDTP